MTRAAPTLLLGGEALIGRTRASRDRALEVAARYHEPESLAVSLSKAIAAGVDGVLAPPVPLLRTALAMLKQPVPLYALVPDPAELDRDTGERDLRDVAARRLGRAGPMTRARAAITALPQPPGFVGSDLADQAALLLEVAAPSLPRRHVHGVIVPARLTDLALASGHQRFFERTMRFVRSRFRALAGFETHNLGHLLARLREWGLAPDLVVGPVNPRGMMMKPTPDELLDELRQARVPVLAKELRAAGTVPLADGAAYARSHGAHGLVVDLVDLDDLGAELRAIRAAGAA